MLLRALILASVATLCPASAAASCADDPVEVAAAASSDAPTEGAVDTLLDGASGPGGWILHIDGERFIATHGPTRQRFARSLSGDSTPYDRALAALELLNAARAACTDVPTPVPPEAPAPTFSPSFAAYGGVRFDADVGGPWLLRPTIGVELGLLRGAAPVFLSLAIEGSALGTYQREAVRQDLSVRYERHDAALLVGVGVPLDALTLLVRTTGGVSIRDVTASLDGAAAGHRVDVGAVLGVAVSCRLRIFGPLGIRLSGELSFAPTVTTYRAAGLALVTEQSARLATTLALDLEAF